MNGRIAIFTDDPGWHGKRLKQAFAARGYEAVYLSLMDCRVDLEEGIGGVVLPGFEDRLPDGVFVRGVPGGTLEQVILRLDFLHVLPAIGVPVYNSARAIEKSVDKAMTSLLLKQADVSTPLTWVLESETQARALLMREVARGHELVLKPLFGSQGTGLRRLAHPGDLPPVEDYQGLYYLQRYVGAEAGAGEDYRVLVIGGTSRAAMTRRGTGWINNVAQGAACLPAPEDSMLFRLAEAATHALDMDYAGVDMIRDREGHLTVLEVNSIPAWLGLQSVVEADIAGMLVDDFLDRHVIKPLQEHFA
ncbi:lysine biosynthesis protein LysX [Sulfuriferula plumbiphila]|uniref:Lysine biosynthesis protein LysX n=1 Tax=Sulfuriferula plumbiphila TaxID=171865 RepID=A0A512L605_9PROT|nr:alpha-L-glutamate ligase [Sulfuriferula plumbiphila]BBP05175.1 lysine biosynthesis protein LysX [Sulfuriferula plumbiphila]GEP29918.1 lysine biosynthesis protein LysX [Sulfuriferula plumbiphila]